MYVSTGRDPKSLGVRPLFLERSASSVASTPFPAAELAVNALIRSGAGDIGIQWGRFLLNRPVRKHVSRVNALVPGLNMPARNGDGTFADGCRQA